MKQFWGWLNSHHIKRSLLLVMIFSCFALLRIGGYAIAYLTGDRDGSITTPLLLNGLYVIDGGMILSFIALCFWQVNAFSQNFFAKYITRFLHRMHLDPKELMLLAISLSVCICCGEIVLSYAKPEIVPRRYLLQKAIADPYIADYSDYLPFTLPPNIDFVHKTTEFNVIYSINALGYRGAYPRTIAKPSATQRILLLGDSFTLGWGNPVEQSYAGRLAATLAPKHYEVINAGYKAGYSPDSYYAFFIKEGLALTPDIVIVFICTENDIDDIQNNIWIKTDRTQAPLAIRTIRNYADYQGELINVKHHRLAWNYETPLLSESRLFIGLTGLFIKQPQALPFDMASQRFQQSINALQQVCRREHLPLLFFLIPAKSYQATTSSLEQNQHRLIRKLLASQQCTYYDLSESLSTDSYFKEDAHLNAQGNAIVYEDVLRMLLNMERGFIRE